MIKCAGGGDNPTWTWRRTLPQDRIQRPLLAPHRFFILDTEEKGKVFESLSLGRVHAFGPDAMLHRVSLETSAEDNKSLEAIYSNSWIQANKKKIGK